MCRMKHMYTFRYMIAFVSHESLRIIAIYSLTIWYAQMTRITIMGTIDLYWCPLYICFCHLICFCVFFVFMFCVLSCLLVKLTCWPVMPIKILNLELTVPSSHGRLACPARHMPMGRTEIPRARLWYQRHYRLRSELLIPKVHHKCWYIEQC